MVRIHLVGSWGPGQVVCRWTGSGLRVPPWATVLIDQAWEQARAKLGERLFDGPMCRLESCRVTGSFLELLISRTSYREFLGTNLTHADWAVEHGPQTLANPIGLSCALTARGGQLLLGRRSAEVAYYPGRIHPFAGALEPAEVVDVFREIIRELREELGCDGPELLDLRCVGLVEDLLLRQPELIFLARSSRGMAEIARSLDPREHISLWHVEPDAERAEHAVRETQLLTPIGKAAVMLWGAEVFGRKWFQRVRGWAGCAEEA